MNSEGGRENEPPGPVAKGVRANAIANATGSLGRAAVVFIAQPILIRLLGLERYGLWLVIQAIATLTLIADFGISLTTTTMVAEAEGAGGRKTVAHITGAALMAIAVIGSLLTAIIFAAEDEVIRNVLRTEPTDEIRRAVLWLALGTLPRLAQQWLGAYQAAFARYRSHATIEFVGAMATSVAFIATASWGYGLDTLTAILAVGSVLTAALHARAVTVAGVARCSFTSIPRSLWSALAGTGFFFFLTSLGSILYGRVDRLVVNVVLGPAAVAIYGAATTIASKINDFSTWPLQPIVPEISAAWSAGRLERVRTLFMRGLSFNTAAVYVLTMFVLWGADWIGLIFIGDRSEVFASTLRVLAVVYGGYSIAAAPFFTCLALRSGAATATASILGGLTTIIALYFAAPWGVIGAAWANAGYIVILSLNVIVMRRIGLPGRPLAVIIARFFVALAGAAGLRYLTVFLAGRNIVVDAIGLLLSLALLAWTHPQDFKVLRMRGFKEAVAELGRIRL